MPIHNVVHTIQGMRTISLRQAFIITLLAGVVAAGAASQREPEAQRDTRSPQDTERHADTPDPPPDREALQHLQELPVEEAIAALNALPPGEALEYAIPLVQHALEGGDRQRAEQLLEGAEQIARSAGKTAMLAEIRSAQAFMAQAANDVAGAMEIMTEVVERTEGAALTDEHIMALIFLGSLQHRYGMLGRALETTERVLHLEEHIQDQRTLARMLSEAAMLNYKLGNLDDVERYLEEALPIFQEQNDENGMGTVYRIYGNYHIAHGRVDAALDYYQRARQLYIRTNNVHDYANISFNTGLIFLQAGNPAGALPHLQNAVENFVAAQSLSGAGMAGTELGRALFQLQRYGEAEQVMAQARRHLESTQSFLRLAQAHAMYGAILFTMGERDPALEAYSNALRLYRRLGMSRDEQRIIETMLRIREGTQGRIEL